MEASTPRKWMRYLAIATVVLALALGSSDALGAEEPSPAMDAFSTTGSLAQARIGHTATLLLDGRVLIVGGEDSDGAHESAEVWNPGTTAGGT